MDSKLAYFTRTYVRGFVATRPFVPTFMFIIMFTFVVFSDQLTLPFPSSWNKDVNIYIVLQKLSNVCQHIHFSYQVININ